VSRWKFDGVQVDSGGTSDDEWIQKQLQDGIASYPYGPPPTAWPVDPSSDWCIHQWVAYRASLIRSEVETDYSPDDSEMPDDVSRYLENTNKTSGSSSVH